MKVLLKDVMTDQAANVYNLMTQRRNSAFHKRNGNPNEYRHHNWKAMQIEKDLIDMYFKGQMPNEQMVSIWNKTYRVSYDGTGLSICEMTEGLSWKEILNWRR